MKSSDQGSDPTQLDTGPSKPAARMAAPDGYELGALLGRGGMGEVILAVDHDLGREVAIKRMRGDLGSSAEARFLREARIQARLEHPAIVPVHEIGRDADGNPYFTMKRLAGTTLAAILDAGTHARQRLLRVFADVCLAIELAHSRGIVHRDLKPANIMLGDFGEVYVLDWGLARNLTEDDVAAPARAPSESENTEAGTLLGTPGYMAPEQARGEVVGPAADVYALGAILFEILAGSPLHPRGVGAIAATLETPTQAPSDRRTDVPPELCIACQSALAAGAAQRPSARTLAEHVERYLDGDRDLERRRTLAAEQLATARTAFASNDRATAMQAAGRALALDPEASEAAEILTRLTLDPPRVNPPELDAHLAASDLAVARRMWRPVGIAWLAFWLALPVVIACGIRDVGHVIALYTFVTANGAVALYWSRAGRPRIEITLVLCIATAIVLSRMFGPFIVLPAVLCLVGSGLAAYPQVMRGAPALGAIGAYVIVLVLEATGVLGTTWMLAGDAIISRSSIVELSGTAGTTMLIGSNIATLVAAIGFAHGIARARQDAHRSLEIQAWHLRKLVPAS